MEEFLNYYKTNYKIKSQYSVMNAKSSIKRLEKLLEKPIDKFCAKDFANSEKLILKLNAMYSYNTSILTLNTLINYLKWKQIDIDIYKHYLNDYIEIRTIWDNSEKEYPFSFTELRAKVEELNIEMMRKRHSFTKYRNYLILAILVLGLPIRLQSFLRMKISLLPIDPNKLPNATNYIVKNTEGEFSFILHNKKRIIYHPPNQILQRLLTNYFTCYSKHHTYFLTNSKADIMSQTNMTNALTSASQILFGHNDTPLTFNIVRKIFLKEFFAKEQTHKERKEILSIIGQTYTTCPP